MLFIHILIHQLHQHYEQDIILSNADGNNFETYLTKADSGYPSCYPTTSWISSSLPNSYLDTRLFRENETKCDSANVALPCRSLINPFAQCGGEVSYTIGSASPDLIQQNRVYINNLETAKGVRNKPVFKVTANLGVKRPNNCLFYIVKPEWCIFSDKNEIMNDFGSANDIANFTNNSTFPYYVKSFTRQTNP
jgi:hypothetical protein